METYREEEACRLREEEERQKKKAEETMKRVSEALEHLSHRQDLLLPRDGKRYRYVSNCIICFFSDLIAIFFQVWVSPKNFSPITR